MKIIRGLFIAVFVFIAITSGFIWDTEYIPDNAQIEVFPIHQYWLPHHKAVAKYLTPELVGDSIILHRLDLVSNMISTTYSEVRNGQYKGYTLPLDFGDETNYIFGPNQSQLRKWLYPKNRRWNDDGSWNY